MADSGAARVEAAQARARPDLGAYAAIWFAVAVWGGSFVAARAVLHPGGGQAGLSPLVLAAVRFCLAGAVFLLPFGRAVLRREVSGRDLLRIAILGQITYSVYFWLQYTGVALTNAGIASILVIGLIPLATSLLAIASGTERFRWRVLLALLLGLGGVIIIVGQNPIQVEIRSGFLLGAFCLIGNAFAFALYVNLGKRWMVRISPVVLTGGTMLSGAMVLVVLSLLIPAENTWSEVPHLAGTQWLDILYLALCCSVAAYFVYNLALTRVSATQATVYHYAEPVIAVALGVALLGERLSVATVVGAATIAAAIALFWRH